MKKFSFCLVLMLILSLTYSALARTTIDEPFSIRNGIHLGMTKDEVSSAETAETISDMEQFFTDNHSSERYASYLRYEGITLAGQKGSGLQYGFDSNEQVKDITYICGNTGVDSYNDMLEKLSSKYGSPDFKEPTILDTEAMRCFSEDTSQVTQSVNHFAGWLIHYSDCYVSIELVNRRSTINSSRSKYDWVYVGYRIITEDEYAELESRVKEYNDSVNESVENDL